jgi:S-methylmethionine-dependent homocysteine/selenocysteine methylase
MHEVLAECETPASPMVISGCVGPRGDGYQVGAVMSPEAATRYHEPQLRTYRDAGADLVSAITMTYSEEAIGIANAAARWAFRPSFLSRWRPMGAYPVARR